MSPKIFLDTDTRINDLISKIKTSDFARSFFITGVRGSGKTVFLTQWLKNWIKMIIVNGLQILMTTVKNNGKILNIIFPMENLLRKFKSEILKL